MLNVEIHGPVRVLRLAHGKANALDLELLGALRKAIDEAAAAPEAAVVLAGAARIFCAGVDLNRVLAERESYLKRFLPALDEVCLALFHFPKPLVAAVNGAAIAGGAVLACAADRRVGARGARIGVPELQLGVPFPLAVLEVVRSVVPASHQGEVLWNGRILVDDAAREAGFFDELVDAGQAEVRALELAAELAKLDSRAFAWNKALVRAPVAERIQRDGPRAAAEALQLWSSPEALAAIERYVAATLRR